MANYHGFNEDFQRLFNQDFSSEIINIEKNDNDNSSVRQDIEK